ncbi:MAG TPA: alkaline phosphatase family protein [Gemmataceae bacterium]|nr:alkaline phosphatase family protein [Gemmataceae bacterium]
MAESSKHKPNRRAFLKRSALAAAAGAAAVGGGAYWLGSRSRVSRSIGKKVIVIGIDGMDPRLSETMMKAGLLPNLARLRDAGGFSDLGTSIPPQSPVAWANFINGGGPGSHGIFDFIHRHPHEQCKPFYSAAETVDGKTLLRRQGVPFWDYLDEAGIPSTFYDLPTNYPASPSHHGHHRCISGMGTPDMLGTYGTYQHFAENGPLEPLDEGGGKRFKLSFESDKATASIVGPDNPLFKEPRPVSVDIVLHRDPRADAAAIEVQGHKILLKAGQWSRWIKLKFDLAWYTSSVTGIVRFYLQEVTPNFRLYVTPVNMDPSAPAQKLSEPESFIKDVSKRLGLFYTTGFQEDHKARSNGVFVDDEFLKQAGMVLEERLALFDYAVDNYDDGLLFFYFSSSDLQSHMFWWDSDDQHPIRSAPEAQKYFGHVKQLYRTLDRVIGELFDRHGSQATIIVMSDHGFANFGRQFNLNSWLREAGYLGPPDCKSIMQDVDWSLTSAYGLGINGLYLNLKGRERDGTVEPGEQQQALVAELVSRLEGVVDMNGARVIRNVYRADKVYSGNATALAPDLIVGYSRGYRASWATCLGDLTEEVLLDNDSAWSADHCADALEVPGVLLSNRPIRAKAPSLVDLAPSILAEFGLATPSAMTGRNMFST